MGWKDIFRRRRNPYYGYGYGDYYDKEYWERQRQKTMERNLETNEKKEEVKENIPAFQRENVKLQDNQKVSEVKAKEDTGVITHQEGQTKKTEIKTPETVQSAKNGVRVERKEDEKAIPKKDNNTFFAPIRKEKKDVIIFAVENSAMVNQYKNEIGKILSKIAKDNDKCLFLFLRAGNNKKYFNIMDYDKMAEEKTIESLFEPCEEEAANVDYLDVLKHVDNFLSPLQLLDLEYKDKKYDIQNKSIIFFGTGTYNLSEQDEDEARRLMKRIKLRNNMRTIRYFCIKDSQTVNVAALGFPVIGHIVADFYK